ncbi:ribonuclease P protein subunit p21 [Danio rerio]|uniref:Ribonuclease P 21 subunit n=1 Tax=Danio rerio TaxID=7955 RepID=Q6DBZ7_DANRE|nr:ribonuclease P protein subunit p21 [Danio rerio]AAH78300.1 Ribonuclease P 21 subunit [Danio rerio]|eukprot:NP_001003530.1 ribonuclease P protein subunit p21 [Danio rerio]
MAGNIKDKEAFQRLNFLYQAAHCVLAQNPENIELARFYCFTQKTISKRLVLRQDPSVKRTICKKCYTLLIPGVTSTVRQKRGKGRQRKTVVRCLSCGLTKRFPNNPKHKLWVDQPEAQLENQTSQGAGPSSNSTTQGKKCDGSSGSASTAAKTTPTAQTNKPKSS